MKDIAHQVSHYLYATLGVCVPVRPWHRQAGLPPYLRDRYELFWTNILGTDYLLVADVGQGGQPPGLIERQLGQIRARSGVEAIYASPAITSYNRQRLIERKTPFIVPGNQMYLPMLGISLREHLKRLREKRTAFSPSTQVLLLCVLWKKATGAMTPAGMAEQLGYSAMTMSRAFDELQTAGIGEQETIGKERRLRFDKAGRELWDEALPYLASPVRRRVYLTPGTALKGCTLAGQSALAHYTRLAEPKVPVVAVSLEDWKEQASSAGTRETPFAEPDGRELEVWRYRPGEFAQDGVVDRLSLYLSIGESDDERVQAAREELLAGMEW